MTHEYRMTLDEAVIRLRNEFNKDGCYVELPLNVAEELLKAQDENRMLQRRLEELAKKN